MSESIGHLDRVDFEFGPKERREQCSRFCHNIKGGWFLRVAIDLTE